MCVCVSDLARSNLKCVSLYRDPNYFHHVEKEVAS